MGVERDTHVDDMDISIVHVKREVDRNKPRGRHSKFDMI